MPKSDSAYLIGFFDTDSNLYDVHVCDDIGDHATWEYLELGFSVPTAKFMLFWRRDASEIEQKEGKSILKYAREDMDEFIREGEKVPQFARIVSKPIGSECLMVSWAPFLKISDMKDALGSYSRWTEFAELARIEVDRKAAKASKRGSLHDRKVNLLDGRLESSPEGNEILEIYRKRKTGFPGIVIPSDDTLVSYLDQARRGDFKQAARVLSSYYEIDSPRVEEKSKTSMPHETFVFYDLRSSTILICPEKIPELWQSVPSFLLPFFMHLSKSKDWYFDENPRESRLADRRHAELFAEKVVRRLTEIGLDPRSA